MIHSLREVLRQMFSKSSRGYYFIHIPKTAGTSFINVFDSLAHESKIFPHQLWKDVQQETVDKKSSYQLMRGHFGGGCHRQLFNKNAELLTILRHPKSLSISTYHFIKREENTRVHDLVKQNNMSLVDFLHHPETQTKISNRMTRHLSFDLQQDPDAHELFLSAKSEEVVNQWLKKGVKIEDSQRFQRAKKRIKACKWFGLVEEFEKSMQLFSFEFKLPPLFTPPKLNSHTPNQNITEAESEAIEALNLWDLQLYDYAQKLFDKKYQQMLATLENYRETSQQTVFDLLDQHYLTNNKLNRINNSKNDLHRIDFDFSDKMLGSGWHRREITLPENSTFRWTSSSQSFIDFWLKPDDYQVKIRIINAVSEEFLNQARVLINGVALESEQNPSHGVVRELAFKVDKSLMHSGHLRISFCTPDVQKHSQSFGSDDSRELGLAVNWVKVRKIS